MNKHYFFKSKIIKYLLVFVLLLRFCYLNNEIHSFEKPKDSNIKANICQEPKRYFDKQVLVLCGDYPYKIQVTTNTFPSFNLYDEVLVRCNLQVPENYSDFNYRDYLYKQNIYFICYSWSISKINEVNYHDLDFFKKIKYRIYLFKKKIVNKIETNLPEPGAGLSKAMFLGLKTEVEPQIKESLENNGLAHILAISGMHIAIIYALIFFLLKKLIVKNKLIKILISFILLAYLAMINFSVSASRAVIMILISFSAKDLKRSLNRLYLAVFIMLLISPALLFNSAMQMSFLAVWSLLTIMPALDHYILKRVSKVTLRIKEDRYKGFKLMICRYIIGIFNNKYFKYFYFLFLSSLAVNIILWPLLLYYFGLYNTFSILLNLLILPIIPLILVLIILGVSVASITFIAKIFFIPLYFIFQYFYVVASIDFSAFYISIDINVYAILFYYLSILLYNLIDKT
jgi:competence protein ComEC